MPDKISRNLPVHGEVTLKFTRDANLLHVWSEDVPEFYISGVRVTDVFADIGPVLRMILQINYGFSWSAPERKFPNAETQAAIQELKDGGGETFATVEALMKDLNSDDEEPATEAPHTAETSEAISGPKDG